MVVQVAFMVTALTCSVWLSAQTPAQPLVERPSDGDTTAVIDLADVDPDVDPEEDPSDGSDEDTGEPRVDVYGNEIDNAVGDYRIDPDGEMYELHSPETEVATLASPRT